ncbi:hypothetical protein BDR22DRAFT_889011 [Usnea florida]
MHNSTLKIDNSVVEPHVAIPQAGENIFQFEEEPRQAPPKLATDKKGGNRKAWAKQKAKAQEGKDEDIRITRKFQGHEIDATTQRAPQAWEEELPLQRRQQGPKRSGPQRLQAVDDTALPVEVDHQIVKAHDLAVASAEQANEVRTPRGKKKKPASKTIDTQENAPAKAAGCFNQDHVVEMNCWCGHET